MTPRMYCILADRKTLMANALSVRAQVHVCVCVCEYMYAHVSLYHVHVTRAKRSRDRIIELSFFSTPYVNASFYGSLTRIENWRLVINIIVRLRDDRDDPRISCLHRKPKSGTQAQRHERDVTRP